MSINLKLSSNIKFLRQTNKLTFKELANNSGTTASGIRQIEKQLITNPKVLTVKKLANYFEIDLETLLFVDLREEQSKKIKEYIISNLYSFKED